MTRILADYYFQYVSHKIGVDIDFFRLFLHATKPRIGRDIADVHRA